MAQTPEGAALARANKAGITLATLRQRESAGQKWCWSCRAWKTRTDFNRDASRYDGLEAKCGPCKRVKVRVCRKGEVSPFRGRKHTDAARAAMSAARQGRPGPNKGGTISPERRAKISAAVRASPKLLRGAACKGYIDGNGVRRRGERASPEYKAWRRAVYERDHFVCQSCGDATGGNLHAHHILGFATHPELRLEVSNGVTLCEGCHKAEHAKAA